MRLRRSMAGSLAGVLLAGSALVLGATSALAHTPAIETAVTFTVAKVFSDHSTAEVSVSLVCSFGTVTPVDTTASEADPADFAVSGFKEGTPCTATEVVPPDYTGSGSPSGTCTGVLTLASGGTCTITNTRTEINVTSHDDNGGMSVTVTGAGFPANTEVTVDIHSTIVELGTETTDADGSFEETFDVPCRVGAGEHEVTATTETGQEAEDDVELDGCSAAQAPQPVTVTPTFTG